MNDGNAFQKRRQLLEMLDQGLVMIHLDPRPEEVIVPSYLKEGPVLRLNLAYGFRLPALDVHAEGVYAVLSFNRQNFGCTLPWTAIFALTSPDKGHDGMVWPSSLPAELRSATEAPSTAGVPLRARPQTGPTAVPDMPETMDTAPAELPPSEVPADSGDVRPAPPPLFKVHTGGSNEASAPSAVSAQSDPSNQGSPASDPEPAPAPDKKRSHLRLVKG